MSFSPDLKEIQQKAKEFIDANMWDGEDRTGCNSDFVKHTPDELQKLIDDLLEHLSDCRYI